MEDALRVVRGSEGDEVDEDVKRIPMPRDTPPPFPKEVLDKWYSTRRERIARERGEYQSKAAGAGTSANSTPLGANDRRAGLGDRGSEIQSSTASVAKVEAKTVYEAKPVVRDLRKEAVSFVPAAVRANLDKGKGKGGLVEPEEADRLEKAGYMGNTRIERSASREGEREIQGNLGKGPRHAMLEEVEDEDG